MTRNLDPGAMKSVRDFASILADLETRIRRMERTASLARSSIVDGAVYAYDGEAPTMVVGAQFDGTNGASVLTGPVPPGPSAPIVTSSPGGLTVKWDGFYGDIDAVSPMDFQRVDVAVGAAQTFDPVGTPPSTAIMSPRGGSTFVPLAPGVFYVALVTRTAAGVASVPSPVVPGEVTESAVVVSAPSTSPPPTVIGTIDAIQVSWPQIAASVEVHISQVSSFTPTLGNRATFVAASDGTSVTVIRLPNGAPLTYTTAYYIRLIAYNDGGAAPPSQVVATALQPGSLQLNDGGTTKTTRLRVTSDVDVDPTVANNEPAVIIGPPAGSHLRIDGNEIWSMSTSTTTGGLGLQGKFFQGWDYGVASITTNAEGEASIPHGLGAPPTVVLVSGTVVGGVYEVRLLARANVAFAVRLLTATGVAAGAGVDADVHWLAIRR